MTRHSNNQHNNKMKTEINYNKTFEQALAAMREGRKVQLKDWGKEYLHIFQGEMCLYFEGNNSSYVACSSIMSNEWGIFPSGEDLAKLNNIKIEISIIEAWLKANQELLIMAKKACCAMVGTSEVVTKEYYTSQCTSVIEVTVDILGVQLSALKSKLRKMEEAL